MMTRRDLLRWLPASAVLASARGANDAPFDRFDAHVHIHRPAPALIEAMKADRWRGLDILVSPASDPGESSDLGARSEATLRGFREAKGAIAWASSFDARGAEGPGFADRVVAELRRSFDDGAVGMKIWKNVGMSIKKASGAYLLPDDPALRPIFEAIEAAGRTLIAHLAEPDGAWLPLDAKNPELAYYSANPQWHMYGKPGAPVKAEILDARDRVLARHPKLKVVGCHLGSDEDDLPRLARRLDAYPNFAVDTAARIRYFAAADRDAARDFLVRYQDRVLYATDFSLRDADPAAAARSLKKTHDLDWAFFATAGPIDYEGRPTRGLALPDEVLRKLYRDNAARWFPALGA